MGHDHESTISSRPPEETCEEISRITYTLFLTSPINDFLVASVPNLAIRLVFKETSAVLLFNLGLEILYEGHFGCLSLIYGHEIF